MSWNVASGDPQIYVSEIHDLRSASSPQSAQFRPQCHKYPLSGCRDFYLCQWMKAASSGTPTPG